LFSLFLEDKMPVRIFLGDLSAAVCGADHIAARAARSAHSSTVRVQKTLHDRHARHWKVGA
jgi:hypothetical protein